MPSRAASASTSASSQEAYLTATRWFRLPSPGARLDRSAIFFVMPLMTVPTCGAVQHAEKFKMARARATLREAPEGASMLYLAPQPCGSHPMQAQVSCIAERCGCQH
jgi:hypothetical protein